MLFLLYIGTIVFVIYHMFIEFDVWLNKRKHNRFLKLAIIIERLFFLLNNAQDSSKIKLMHLHLSRLLEFSDLFLEIYTCLPDYYRLTLFRVVTIHFGIRKTSNLDLLNAANDLFCLFYSLIFEACCNGKISSSNLLEVFIHKLSVFPDIDV